MALAVVASGVFPRPSFQSSLSVPGTTRLVPDISWLADPYTGVEIIITDPTTGQLSVTTIGGTSLACPMFSALMAIASEKAGHGLGQAAQRVYSLPAGAVTDVTAVSSPNDVTGVTDGSRITADALASPLGNTTSYFSALYNSPHSTRWFVITFGMIHHSQPVQAGTTLPASALPTLELYKRYHTVAEATGNHRLVCTGF
jgi:subtilase family serine protease